MGGWNDLVISGATSSEGQFKTFKDESNISIDVLQLVMIDKSHKAQKPQQDGLSVVLLNIPSFQYGFRRNSLIGASVGKDNPSTYADDLAMITENK